MSHLAEVLRSAGSARLFIEVAAGNEAARRYLNKEIDAKLNATAQTPTRGGAKQFSEVMARQRAHIATIAKALDLKPIVACSIIGIGEDPYA